MSDVSKSWFILKFILIFYLSSLPAGTIPGRLAYPPLVHRTPSERGQGEVLDK